MYPKTFTWEQLNELYKDPVIEGGFNGRKCDHWGNRCLNGWLAAMVPLGGAAIWHLVNPIDLTKLVGEDKKVTKITAKCCYDWWWASSGWINSIIQLFGDETKIWESGDLPTAKSPDWEDSTHSPNIDVTPFSTLDVVVRQQGISTGADGIGTHAAMIILTLEYNATIPPEHYDCHFIVKNKETGRGIIGASVRLLIGDTIAYSGTTGLDGTLTISSVEEGSYTLKISASGYYDFTRALPVTGPMEITAYLIPVPKPWYFWPLVIGGVGFGGLIIGKTVIEARKKPVIVVR